MKILVKFPTRQRPSQSVVALNACIENQTTNNVHYLLTVDKDDRSMDAIVSAVENHENITVDVGVSKSKINAVNRGIDTYKQDWDIIVLLSDDMICQKKGWDNQIIGEMLKYYSDTDGVLFHNDGFVGERLNTMCILGRKYYERFGYIYNPEYKSLYCDNEFMDVANELKLQTYFSEVLFKHEHPANNGELADALYNSNDKHFQRDKSLYLKRKQQNFNGTNKEFQY